MLRSHDVRRRCLHEAARQGAQAGLGLRLGARRGNTRHAIGLPPLADHNMSFFGVDPLGELRI